MSLNVTTKLPALGIARQIAPRYQSAAAVQRRYFSFRSFWSKSASSTKQAEWSPAIDGPHRPSKLQIREQQEKELAEKAAQEYPIPEESEVGQVDGAPAKHVAVEIDGNARVFDTAFLRDSCSCLQCKDPHSKQKVFQTSDIPEDLEGSYKLVEDEEKGPSIEVQWKNDVKGYGPDHRTRHSIDWLRRAIHQEVELRGGVRHDDRVLWDKQRITKDNKWLDYNDYIAQDVVL